jgi:hypothetical protein
MNLNAAVKAFNETKSAQTAYDLLIAAKGDWLNDKINDVEFEGFLVMVQSFLKSLI